MHMVILEWQLKDSEVSRSFTPDPMNRQLF